MKFLVAAIVGLGIMLLSPASAQWGSQPSTANCRAYLTYPAEFGDLPFIYRGVCPSGTAEGRQTVVAEPDGSPQGTTFTITSTFKNGRTTGQTSIRSSFGVTFDGFIGQNGIVIGRTTFPDGHATDGESRKGRMWTGIVSRSADVSGGANYFVSGTAAAQNVSLVSQPKLPSPRIAAATNGSTSGRPPCYMELPFIKNQMNVSGSYPGICIGGKYHGQATFQLDDPSDPNFIPMEYTVNVKDGKVFGVGIISIGNGAVTYTGTLKNYRPWDGTNVAYDERGNPVRDGFLRGKNVPLAQAPRTLAFTPYVPPKEPSAPARQAKAGTCFAERPTDRYFVTGQFPGECKGGKYSGTTELTLSPKDPHDPIVKLTATYRDGTLSGPVKAVYPQYALTYRGTFDGFVVGSGRAEQPLGNRTFDITEYQNGQIVSSRTEYRPPSEFEQALIAAAGRLGERLGTQLGREIDGTAARQRDAQQQAKADKLRQRDIARADEITREAQATAGQKVRDEQLAQQQARDQAQADWQRQSDATIEDARRKALSGLDAEGNPVSPPSTPVKVASNDPPNFGGKTSPPEFAVKTNPPETQTRPIVTTNPPEVPAPHPAAPPSIPEPEKVAELPPPHSPGVQPPLGPVTPLPDPSSVPPPIAPAVQPPRQNDTLGTGSAPSNPVPQQPSQPAADVASRPAPIPANSQPTPTTLAAPMRIAPTNPGELAPTIPIQWTPVSGATRYELAVRDLTTNAFVVDQPVYQTVFERSPYPTGKTFRWTVRACNQSGCGGWSQGWEFRTAGAANGTSATNNVGRDALAGASQGTRDCVNTLARETGESVEAAYQLVTSAGGWQQLAGGVAHSAWNIIRHPIQSAKAAWNGLTGQVSGVRDAVNAGNPSLACQRAVKLSASVIGAAEGAQAARVTLSNLKRVQSGNVTVPTTSIVNAAVDTDARNHILNGDTTGGGHRFGTGKSGNTEFPKNWSDSKIIASISQVAAIPSAVWTKPGTGTYIRTEGYVDGILIRVVYDLDKQRIVSGYPRNTPQNP